LNFDRKVFLFLYFLGEGLKESGKIEKKGKSYTQAGKISWKHVWTPQIQKLETLLHGGSEKEWISNVLYMNSDLRNNNFPKTYHLNVPNTASEKSTSVGEELVAE